MVPDSEWTEQDPETGPDESDTEAVTENAEKSVFAAERPHPNAESLLEERARRLKGFFRFAAIAFFLLFLIGWPLGQSMAHHQITGTFGLRFGFTLSLVLVMFAVPLLIIVLGEASALIVRFAGTALRLETAAAQYIEPAEAATEKIDTIGTEVRRQIDDLNSHLDDSLSKLANVESMIRVQVDAIRLAGDELTSGAGGAVENVANEREKLIALTEKLNNEADSFAEAIAEKARLGSEANEAAEVRLSTASEEMDTRLARLEETASRALDAFEDLSRAISEKQEQIAARHQDIDAIHLSTLEKQENTSKVLEERANEIVTARQKLEEESRRLESLIEEQRGRAEKLADAITQQTERLDQVIMTRRTDAPLTPLPDAPAPETPPLKFSAIVEENPSHATNVDAVISGGNGAAVSTATIEDSLSDEGAGTVREQRHARPWSSILAAAELPEDSLAPAGSALTAKTAPTTDQTERSGTVQLVFDMQDFMQEMDRTLFGEPEPAVVSRFENGERNIFAHILLGHDEEDLKQRIRQETSADPVFEQRMYDFLKKFDRLLEPAADEEDGESLIDDYLGSPIGQVYVLAGAALDYFA